jgi:hypothetical protein
MAVLIEASLEGGEVGGKDRDLLLKQVEGAPGGLGTLLCQGKKLVTGHNNCFTIQTGKKLHDQAKPE